MTAAPKWKRNLDEIATIRSAGRAAGTWPKLQDLEGPRLEHEGQLRMAYARRSAGLPPHPRDLEAFAAEGRANA